MNREELAALGWAEFEIELLLRVDAAERQRILALLDASDKEIS